MARDRYFRYEVVGLREGLVQTAWRNVGSGVLNMMGEFLVLVSVLLFWTQSCCCCHYYYYYYYYYCHHILYAGYLYIHVYS